MVPAPVSVLQSGNDDVVVVFVNVGQGDCTIIIDRSLSQAVVIDCPAGGEDAAAAILDRFGAQIHTAVITHFDDDHSAGLVALLAEFQPQQLLVRIDQNETEAVKDQFRQLAAMKNRQPVRVTQPDPDHDNNLVVGRAHCRVLGPSAALTLAAATRRTPKVRGVADRNRTSIVVRIDVLPPHGGTGTTRSVLIAGDSDRAAWLDMLNNQVPLRADMFRWPHHGAPIEGGGVRRGARLVDEVLSAVNPEVVYMGVGSTNSHQHPHLNAIASMRGRNITHYCSQVTPRCAHTTVAAGTQCGGDLEVVVDSSGGLRYERGRKEQEDFVLRWPRPHCVIDMNAIPFAGGT